MPYFYFLIKSEVNEILSMAAFFRKHKSKNCWFVYKNYKKEKIQKYQETESVCRKEIFFEFLQGDIRFYKS